MKKLLFLSALLSPLFSGAQTQSVTLGLPDIVINGTTLKRKAQAATMTYNLDRQSVSVMWRVGYYSDSSNAFGEKLLINGVSDYFKTTIADNSVIVNPYTGDFVEKDSLGNYPEGSIGQYDFFWNIAENIPIKVNELIYEYGLNIKTEDW